MLYKEMFAMPKVAPKLDDVIILFVEVDKMDTPLPNYSRRINWLWLEFSHK